ncbi:VirB3 family type IV secretion system protein [Legionella feeleii]|uniref:Protein LvhB4 n=1 Tax=Legionella feeleii TaxID=453 RepID=A0A378IVN9_9GAMM|nr:VirB3 family type IV secretion system protein [Legionella feeleii]STX39298.1 protein LvhB4 [Legionella feeleii]
MQGNRGLLQKDLLAKAMTRSTNILGVPFNFVINNIALFVLLTLIFYIITQQGLSLFITLFGMVLSHLAMMMLSLKEERALPMLLANASLCHTTPFSQTNSYTPLKAFIKKPLVHEKASSQHIPWTHLYDEHTVMTRKGELIQVLSLDGLSFHTSDDLTIDDNKALRNRLLYQLASPHIAISFYTIKRKESAYPKGSYPKGYAHNLNERYKTKIRSEQRFHNALYIVLMYKAPALKKAGKKNRVGEVSPTQASFYAKGIKALNEHSARLVSLFKDCHCKKLGAESQNYQGSELLSFLSELVNLEKRFVRKPLGALNTAMATKSHHFARRRGVVQVNGANGRARFAAMLSLKEYPDETDACLLDTLLHANCEFIVTQSFFFKQNQQALRELSKQQRKMVQTDDSVLLANAIDVSIEELKAGKAAYGEHHLSLCVIADDLESLNKGIDEIESKLNQEAGLILVREEQGVELAFWAQLPGNQAYRIRQSLISSLNVAGFASLHNVPKGKAEGNHWGHALMLLETLAGTSFYFNIHVGEVGNAIFIGPMGGGKTLMLSAILAFSLKFGGWRFVFDKDRGMEVITRALGGSYQVIEPGKPSGMAPLQLEDTPANRAFNCLLLKKLLSTTTVLSAQDEKRIAQAVNGAYELDKGSRLYRHIAPFFGPSHPGSLRERFDRFHSAGQTAWLFDNDEDVFSISNKITGHDIGKLLSPAFEEISTAALMYLFHRISECLDSSPTIAFIPEGWKALSDSHFQTQLKDWSKTPRKNNMALIMDTQNPDDLAASSAGSSIAREARTQVYFAHSEAKWADYCQFNLTQKEFEIIKDVLPSIGGHFFLLKQGVNSVIARLNLTSMECDIPVLSSNLSRALLLDEIRAHMGDNPDLWLPYYTKLCRILEKDYQSDFSRFKPHFKTHWEQCA